MCTFRCIPNKEWTMVHSQRCKSLVSNREVTTIISSQKIKQEYCFQRQLKERGRINFQQVFMLGKALIEEKLNGNIRFHFGERYVSRISQLR